MAKIFADTTAFFELYAGTSAARAEARRLLAARGEVATSEHVVREWKRISVASIGAMIAAVEAEPDLQGALARLGVAFGREGSQRWRAAAMVCGSSSYLDASLVRLRGRQILRELDARIDRVAGEVRRSSDCGLAEQQPVERPDGGWEIKDRCVRGEGICRHDERLSSDEARWRDGANALDASADKSLEQMASTALEMADQPAKRTGRNCYGRTGDLAIALDCRSTETLVTTDKSFMTLGPAMGFNVHRIAISRA